MQRIKTGVIAEKELINNIVARRVIGIVGFLLLIASGAYLYLPLPNTPVPLTLQTFFVLLCAVFLTKKDALLTQCMYLGLGALGLPFFSAGGGGIAKLFGPTGGYIVGFIFASFIVSFMMESYFYPRTRSPQAYPGVNEKTRLQAFGAGFYNIERKYSYTAGVMSLGMLTILFFGSLWLFFFMKVSFTKVLLLGAVPFVAGDILKVILAATIYCRVSERTRNIFR